MSKLERGQGEEPWILKLPGHDVPVVGQVLQLDRRGDGVALSFIGSTNSALVCSQFLALRALGSFGTFRGLLKGSE